MSEPIRSAEEFTEALNEVANRYMAHLEPSADAQVYSVRMDMAGERLNINFQKAPGQTPYISFTLQTERRDDATPDDSTEQRGIFGRRP